jgi:hypothetical protein
LPLPGLTGLAGAPLEGIADGPLLAVASRHARAPFAPEPDALWSHYRVVEALMDQRAVLPVRFGASAGDADAVRARLRARPQPLLGALEHVRGRVELAVRALRSTPPRACSGREHLRGLADEAHVAAALHEPLAALAIDSRQNTRRSPGELLRGAYLVDTHAVSQFRRSVRRLQREHADVAVLCTGPWAAFSFVDA